jgi:hypothetical protein
LAEIVDDAVDLGEGVAGDGAGVVVAGRAEITKTTAQILG